VTAVKPKQKETPQPHVRQKRPLSTPDPKSAASQGPPPRKRLFQGLTVSEAAPGGGKLQLTVGERGSISKEAWEGIVTKLTSAILTNRDGTSVKINGNGRNPGSGWGNFHCQDGATVAWVSKKVTELFTGVYKTWPPGTQPPEDNARQIYTWISGNEAPTSEFLRDALAHQNEGVDVASWTILFAAKSAKSNGYTLRLKVSPESILKLGWTEEALKTEDPFLRPGLYYGAARIRFWVWSSKDSNPEIGPKGKGGEEGDKGVS